VANQATTLGSSYVLQVRVILLGTRPKDNLSMLGCH
jgi:hypothetical protein